MQPKILSLLCLVGLSALPCRAGLQTITLFPGGAFSFSAYGADTELLVIYDSSLFPAGVGNINIQEISFYSQGGYGGPLPETAINLFLGTTSVASAQLSGTYGNNISDGEALVFTGTPAGGAVAGYTIPIQLSTPFEYIPNNGNLLLDIRNTGDEFTLPYFIGAADYPGVAGVPPVGSVNVYGSLIQFTGVVNTPEPGFSGVFAVGMVGLLFEVRRRKSTR
jgi:hypothetical protein